MDDVQESMFERVVLQSGSREEISLKEAIYDVDAAEMFAKHCKDVLGLHGMRLDLFYEDKPAAVQ